MRLFTYVLTTVNSPFVITSDMNVARMSILADTKGLGTIQGNLKIGARASAALTINAGEGLTIDSPFPGSPLEGITIACQSDNILIMLGVQ